MPPWTSRKLISFVTVLVVLLCSGPTFSQNPPVSAPQTPAIISYLTETINWYRGTAVEQQIANEPSDITFADNNRRISGQIVRLAFDFARLEEQRQTEQPKGSQTQNQAAVVSQNQRLIQVVTKADQQVEQSQNELQSLRQKLETTPKKMRPPLESLIAEAQSELAFRQARRDALHNILQFTTEASNHGAGAAGLRAQIEELVRLVPDVINGAEGTTPEQTSTGKPTGKTSPPVNRQQPTGIWGLAADLIQLSRKGHTLDQQIQSTDRLMQAGNAIARTSVGKPQKIDSERRSTRQPAAIPRSHRPRPTEEPTGYANGTVQAELGRTIAAQQTTHPA